MIYVVYLLKMARISLPLLSIPHSRRFWSVFDMQLAMIYGMDNTYVHASGYNVHNVRVEG